VTPKVILGARVVVVDPSNRDTVYAAPNDGIQVRRLSILRRHSISVGTAAKR
jgi:hypothetical protein